MKTRNQKLLTGQLALALLITSIAPRLTAAPAIDPDADRILRAAYKYLADAKSFCVKVEVWKDVVLPTGQKIQTTRALDVQELRPNRLHIEVQSPRESRGFWYQNKTLTMLERSSNLYGVMEVPDTIDKTIDAVEDRFAVEIPLADLLVSEPYQNVIQSVDSAEDLGKVTVGGVVCNHVAFTGPKADCQLWLADGPKPLPRKCVITLKTKPGSPQITQLFSDWDLVSPISESVFAFVPPEGASRIVVNPKKAEENPESGSSGAAASDVQTSSEEPKTGSEKK
jgi:hypothetical protein